MNKKNLIVTIVVLVLIILGLCVFIFYDKDLFGINTNDKKESINTVDDEGNNDTIKNNETAYVVEGYNKRVSWPFPETLSPDETEKTIDIVNQAVLPKITVDTDNAKKINDKIMTDYKTVTDIIDQGANSSYKDSPRACYINYDYSVNDNIIFILITSSCGNYRGGGSTTHIGYYYDIKNDKELTTLDILNKYGITINDINEKINNENINRGATDPSNASHIVEVTNLNQIPAVMTIINVKSFDVYVETSKEPYVAYIYKP